MSIYSKIRQILKGTQAAVAVREFDYNGGCVSDVKYEVTDVESASDIGREAINCGVPVCRMEQNGKLMVAEPYFPKERLIILGGGHVSLHTAEFAAKCGFMVTVVDDRPEFANKERFPWAEEVICDNFMTALEALAIRESDYVCILTRGHKWDADCLRVLCQGSEPAYLGMIGSRRKIAAVYELLLSEGIDKERFDRVHAPIGLNIGGITPEEISFSIVSELIAVKRLGVPGKLINKSDVDYKVIKYLAEQSVPMAIVTVIKAVGSSPRGAGAKMLVYRDGGILGSIGGGTGEAIAMKEAEKIIGTGMYKVIHIDLGGEAAAADGMVCGGAIDVLVEDFTGTYPQS